jgi:hypothetical protein
LNITNNYTSKIVLTSIAISWPSENGDLEKIKLGAATIWNGEASSPAAITLTGPANARNIGIGKTEALAFIFDEGAAGSGYNVTLTFDVGCTLNASR